MPKIKTNKTVYGKFRARKNGFKRGQANRSHNTARRSPKRIRQLRPTQSVDAVSVGALKRLLPHGA